MVRSFVSTEANRDMQPDTFNIVADLINYCRYALTEKNPHELYNQLDALYCIIHSRVGGQIDGLLEELRNMLYNQEFGCDDEDEEQQHLSAALDKGREVFKLITKELNKQGILFRIKVDPGELIIQ